MWQSLKCHLQHLDQMECRKKIALNVLDGIKGVINSSQDLNEYFLTASEMRNIIGTFYDIF